MMVLCGPQPQESSSRLPEFGTKEGRSAETEADSDPGEEDDIHMPQGEQGDANEEEERRNLPQ